MGYSTTIIEVGPDASDFPAEQMTVTSMGGTPEKLRSYCSVIDKLELTSPLAIGQPVLIGDQEWRIATIGDVAEKNLGALEHTTLIFDGASGPRLPRALHFNGSHLGPALAAGTRLVIGNA